MTRWVRLGLRLSLGSGRAGLLRTGLMSTGAALGVFVVLACLATVSVASAQLARAEARTPVHTERAASALHLLDIDDVIGSRPLRRTAVAGVTAGAPRPPGVAAWPRAGEAVVSPALAALLAEGDPRASERFPQQVVGMIDRTGLVAPDELRAYVGTDRQGPLLDNAGGFRGWPVTGFGDELQYAIGSSTAVPDAFTPSRLVAVVFALFVLVPFGVFLGVCARLSATTRDRRIAALRLLGVSARQATVVNAVETGVVAGCGAIVGLLAFLGLARMSEGWHVGRLHWFAADVTVPPSLICLVVGLVVLFAVLVGVLAIGTALAKPVAVRRDAPAPRPSALRAVPLLLSLAAALAATLDLDPDTGILLFTAAVLGTGLSLPFVLPWLGYGLAGLVRRIPRSPVWLELATGRMRHAPGVAPRLVASLTVTVYIVGLALLGTSLFINDRNLRLEPSSGERRMLSLSNGDDRLVEALRTLSDVDVFSVSHVPVRVNGDPSNILVADCADFAKMYVLAAGQSCVDGNVYRLDNGFAGRGVLAADQLVLTSAGVPLPKPAGTLSVRPREDTWSGGLLLVTRRAPAADSLQVDLTSTGVVVPNLDRADQALRIVSSTSPTAVLEGDLGIRQGYDTDLLVTLLVVGLAISFALSVGAFAAAAVDRTMERRRDNATLAVVGVSRRTTTLGEIAFGGLPLAIGLAAATLATLVIAGSLGAVMDAPISVLFTRMSPVLWMTAAALLVGLGLLAVPAWVAQRLTTEYLRRP
ncbi:FtsX-like permease family protein [Asanoa siamensis]|uniref:ABC3 transporter permease C-terminal domain-containing protein n=1 Tax=Asanoa siamensis TaxID=926357 RepID=A0ABQ4D4K4_9ACTN|nr:ABC transporter permease [Asanoa siamensis]GIF78188.1 hypothetical protein Asi02nite_77060 [Asanoa siamensis]